MDQQNILSLRDDKVYSSTTGQLLYRRYSSQPINWRTVVPRDMILYESGVSNIPKRLKVRDIE